MASAGGSVKSQGTATLKCVLCRDIFRNPRVLTCFHTFCEHCLDNLVKRPSQSVFGKLLCPTCRQETALPPGGVSAFKTNFYIDPDDLEKARNGLLCAVHPKLELDYYCVDCDLVLCVKCAITDHKSHNTGDLAACAETVTIRLREDVEQTHKSLIELDKHLKVLQKKQKVLQDRRTEINTTIREKQNRLRMVVDTFVAEAERSLDKAAEDIWQEDVSRLQQLAKNLRDLQSLANSALSSGSGFKLVAAAREMRRGQDMRKDLQRLTGKQLATTGFPLLGCSDDLAAIRELIGGFLGKAFKVDVQSPVPEVTIVHVFSCASDSVKRIFCVCPLDSGSFYVSYEAKRESEMCPSQFFDSKGKTVITGHKVVGKTSWTGRTISTASFVSNGDKKPMSTFAKSPVVYKLTDMGVHSSVTRTTVVSNDSFSTRNDRVFNIKCGPHRAFDVDLRERLFVVVVEAVPPAGRRTVQLFRYPLTDPVCTYSPGMEPFQPSDVCFYTLGGREVLLVADERNLIHVVNFAKNSLTFSHFLAPRGPRLAHPTALNTDNRGRLWVACRGGRVLVCTPVSSGNCLATLVDAAT